MYRAAWGRLQVGLALGTPAASRGFVEFEWDRAKSHRCTRERGFSFADILPAFADSRRRVALDTRFDYGEERFQLFGHVQGRLYVIVFTHRDDGVRIVSAREANARAGLDAGLAGAHRRQLKAVPEKVLVRRSLPSRHGPA